jgi:serine/threonine protein kinase
MATLGGFELKGRAGVGGMGELFFASRGESLPGFPDGQPVVLKWVPHSGPNPQWLTALHHELDTLSRLGEVNFAQLAATGGVGIAHVQPVGLDSEGKWTYVAEGVVEGDDWEEPQPVPRTYIVLDDIRGTSLKKYLEDRKSHRISDHEAAIVAFRLARLLHLIHDEGRLLHNDLKPDNIIIGPGAVPFRLTLIDYGISVPLNERLEAGLDSHDLVYWGVQEYMAPEKRRGGQDAAGRRLDWRSELWALGAVTLALLGRAALLRGDISAVLDSLDGIPPSLQAFLRKSLHQDPDQRYESWDLVEQDLRVCLELLEDEPPERRAWTGGVADGLATFMRRAAARFSR